VPSSSIIIWEAIGIEAETIKEGVETGVEVKEEVKEEEETGVDVEEEGTDGMAFNREGVELEPGLGVELREGVLRFIRFKCKFCDCSFSSCSSLSIIWISCSFFSCSYSKARSSLLSS